MHHLKYWLHAVPFGLAIILAHASHARVISVGPDGEFKRIADAARYARNGDVVEIAPGRYVADVAIWPQDDLVIRGSGEGVVLEADGASIEGKAIWVIRGNRVEVSKVTFTGARVPDGNGAGIRLERGSLMVRDCQFVGNQMGILTSNDASIDLRIVDSRFSDAVRTGQSLPHLLYAGSIRSLVVEGSSFKRGKMAHLVKSRARRSWIAYNRIDDGLDGEAAYELEFPDGGDVTAIGNIVGQSTTTSNPVMLAYGSEGRRWPINSLDVYHNTFVSRGWFPAWFVRVWQHEFESPPRTRVINNLFVGVGLPSAGIAVDARGNHFSWSWMRNVESIDGVRPRDRQYDTAPLQGEELALVPVAEPKSPIGKQTLLVRSPSLPGALQMPAAIGSGLKAWRLN